ncbi:hypothetical protein BH24BAC1_BH24BAC1_32360 [soil metagenome]
MVRPEINAPLATGKNYDSEFCGSLPLHFVNLIQPHGVLLVVDKAQNQVKQVSENISDFFSLPAASFLN